MQRPRPTSNASRARRSGSSRLRPRRRSSSGTDTRSCSAHSPILASSLDRFALEIRHLARTEVREVEEPFGRGQKGSSAMPHKRNPIVSERICGLARLVRGYAIVGLENVALWHERDISHSSAERVVLPDAFLAVDYMLDRFAWLVEGLVVRPERMRANLETTGGLFFSQRLLLALVESGLTETPPTAWCSVTPMRAWDEGLDFRALVRSDAEIAARVDLAAVFDLGAYTRHVDDVFARRSSPARRRGGAGVTSRAAHVASGKVREIYALRLPETLALVASDRISTFDVVLPTPIPDKGLRAYRSLGVLVRGALRHRPRTICSGSRDDGTHHGLPEARDAADRVRRSRISRRVRVEGLSPTGRVCGHELPGRAQGVRRGCRSRSSRPRRRPPRVTTRTSTRSAPRSCAVRTVYREAKAVSLELYRFGRAHAEAPRDRSSRTRSSSSASRPTARSCSETRR